MPTVLGVGLRWVRRGCVSGQGRDPWCSTMRQGCRAIFNICNMLRVFWNILFCATTLIAQVGPLTVNTIDDTRGVRVRNEYAVPTTLAESLRGSRGAMEDNERRRCLYLTGSGALAVVKNKGSCPKSAIEVERFQMQQVAVEVGGLNPRFI